MSDENPGNKFAPPPPPPPPPAFKHSESVDSALDKSPPPSPSPGGSFTDELQQRLQNPQLRTIRPEGAPQNTLGTRDALNQQIRKGTQLRHVETKTGPKQHTGMAAALNAAIKALGVGQNESSDPTIALADMISDLQDIHNRDTLLAQSEKILTFLKTTKIAKDWNDEGLSSEDRENAIKNLYNILLKEHIPKEEIKALIEDARILKEERLEVLIHDIEAEIEVKNADSIRSDKGPSTNQNDQPAISTPANTASISRQNSFTSQQSYSAPDPKKDLDDRIRLQLNRFATQDTEAKAEILDKILLDLAKNSLHITDLKTSQKALETKVNQLLGGGVQEIDKEVIKSIVHNVRKVGITIDDEDALEVMDAYPSEAQAARPVHTPEAVAEFVANHTQSMAERLAPQSVNKVTIPEALKSLNLKTHQDRASNEQSQARGDKSPKESHNPTLGEKEFRAIVDKWLRAWNEDIDAKSPIPTPPPVDLQGHIFTEEQSKEIRAIVGSKYEAWKNAVQDVSPVTPQAIEQENVLDDSKAPPLPLTPPPPARNISSARINLAQTAEVDFDDIPPPSELKLGTQPLPEELISRASYDRKMARFYNNVVGNPDFGSPTKDQVGKLILAASEQEGVNPEDSNTLSKHHITRLRDHVLLSLLSAPRVMETNIKRESTQHGSPITPASQEETSIPQDIVKHLGSEGIDVRTLDQDIAPMMNSVTASDLSNKGNIEALKSYLKGANNQPPQFVLDAVDKDAEVMSVLTQTKHPSIATTQHLTAEHEESKPHKPAPPPPSSATRPVTTKVETHMDSPAPIRPARPAPPPPSNATKPVTTKVETSPAPIRPARLAPPPALVQQAKSLGQQLHSPDQVALDINLASKQPPREAYRFTNPALNQVKALADIDHSEKAKSIFHKSDKGKLSIFALTKKIDEIGFKSRDERKAARQSVIQAIRSHTGEFADYTVKDWYTLQKEVTRALQEGHRQDHPKDKLTKHGRELLEAVRENAHSSFLGSPDSADKTQRIFEEIKALSAPGRELSKAEKLELYQYVDMYKKTAQLLHPQDLSKNAQFMHDLAIAFPKSPNVKLWDIIQKVSIENSTPNIVEEIVREGQNQPQEAVTKTLSSKIKELFSYTKSPKELTNLSQILAHELYKVSDGLSNDQVKTLNNTLKTSHHERQKELAKLRTTSQKEQKLQR